jgi:hypothetical protein
VICMFVSHLSIHSLCKLSYCQDRGPRVEILGSDRYQLTSRFSLLRPIACMLSQYSYIIVSDPFQYEQTYVLSW